MNRSLSYYPMHMHLHTCFQPGMSMAAHMHNANKLGMRYIWFTDHDTATGGGRRVIKEYSFADGLLTRDGYGFYETEFADRADFTYGINQKSEALEMVARADNRDQWQSAGVYFHSTGHRHNPALLMETSLVLNLQTSKLKDDCRLVLDVSLSQRPPECKKAHMLYVLGDTAGLEAEDHQILPLRIENGLVELPLYQDVSDDPMIGGKDNVFDTITITLQVRSGAEMSVSLKDFKIHFNKTFEQARQAQIQEANRVGEIYNITPFVGFEYSATEHKNCFSTNVPIADLPALGYRTANCFVAEHTKKYGGVFAINHPLAISALKRKEFTPEQRLQVVARTAATLLSCDAYGAQLLEVGYPMGRNGFDLQAYLMVWDLLSAGGLFLCGYGCNDCHRNNDNWFEGNNFATWLGVDSTLQHPISEQAFMTAMQKGNAYCGDPVVLKDKVEFATTDGYPQGTVFTTAQKDQVSIAFSALNVQIGWCFRLIENGHEVYTQQLQEGDFSYESTLCPSASAVSFQRAEIYDETGRCILLTNPIYLVKSEELTREIPKWRLPEEQL